MRILWGFFFLILVGCASTAQYELSAPGELPTELPNWEIAESSFIGELNRTYGQGVVHERAKIKYLLGQTTLSDWQFDRNGMVYDGKTTAKHLRRKYQKRLKDITTAKAFIENIASKSSQSRREYYALPGDGYAYRTGDILKHELNRLEAFMEARNS